MMMVLMKMRMEVAADKENGCLSVFIESVKPTQVWAADQIGREVVPK